MLDCQLRVNPQKLLAPKLIALNGRLWQTQLVYCPGVEMLGDEVVQGIADIESNTAKIQPLGEQLQ